MSIKYQHIVVNNDLNDDSYVKTSNDLGVLNGELWLLSSSYTFSASYALSSSYAVTSSHALQTISSSYALTSSYAERALSSSYALTSSYAERALSSSYALTSSYALQALSSSYALTSSYVESALSSSYALTSSYAVTSSYIDFIESSSYALTSSYAVTSSYIDFIESSSYALTSSYAETALSSSYALTSSYALSVSESSITYSKIQDVSGLKLLGNPSDTLGDVREISRGTKLSFDGNTLNSEANPSDKIKEIELDQDKVYDKTDFDGANYIILKSIIETPVYVTLNSNEFVANDFLTILIDINSKSHIFLSVDSKNYNSSIRCVFDGSNWIIYNLGGSYKTNAEIPTYLSYGLRNSVSASNSTAVGFDNLSNNEVTSLGSSNFNSISSSVNIGFNNYNTFKDVIIGNENTSDNKNTRSNESIILGFNNKNIGSTSALGFFEKYILIGSDHNVNNYSIDKSIIIGKVNINSDIKNSTSIGYNNNIPTKDSVLIGNSSSIYSDSSSIVGTSSSIDYNSPRSVILGSRSSIGQNSEDSVVIGAGGKIGSNSKQSILISNSGSSINSNSPNNIIIGNRLFGNSSGIIAITPNSTYLREISDKNVINIGNGTGYYADTINIGTNEFLKKTNVESTAIGFKNYNYSDGTTFLIGNTNQNTDGDQTFLIGNDILGKNESVYFAFGSAQGVPVTYNEGYSLYFRDKTDYSIVNLYATSTTSSKTILNIYSSTKLIEPLRGELGSSLIKVTFLANRLDNNSFFGEATYYLYKNTSNTTLVKKTEPFTDKYPTSTTASVAWGIEIGSGDKIQFFASQSHTGSIRFDAILHIYSKL